MLDKAAIAKLVASLPALDVLFNCAGFVHSGTALQATDEEWNFALEPERALAVLDDPGGAAGCWPPARGSIINMASVCSSIKGLPNRFIYGTTKAAVIGLTKSVAADFVADGIRCNAMCPGTVDTPSLQDRINANADPEAARKTFIARQPMGRLAQAQEIAPLVVFLASDESVVRDRPGLRGRRRHHDMNQLDFKGRHAVVTGGATGLGYAHRGSGCSPPAAASRCGTATCAGARQAPPWALGAKAHAVEVDVASTPRCSRPCRPRLRTRRAHRRAGQQRRHHRSQHQGLGVSGGRLAAGDRRQPQRPVPSAAAKSCR